MTLANALLLRIGYMLKDGTMNNLYLKRKWQSVTKLVIIYKKTNYTS